MGTGDIYRFHPRRKLGLGEIFVVPSLMLWGMGKPCAHLAHRLHPVLGSEARFWEGCAGEAVPLAVGGNGGHLSPLRRKGADRPATHNHVCVICGHLKRRVNPLLSAFQRRQLTPPDLPGNMAFSTPRMPSARRRNLRAKASKPPGCDRGSLLISAQCRA
jgi:hypothetical protein